MGSEAWEGKERDTHTHTHRHAGTGTDTDPIRQTSLP
jgi:hypothetical protein